MTRGMAMLLTLLVLASALFAGWYSTRREDYFPESFATTLTECRFEEGQSERQPVLHPADDEWFSGELAAFHEPSLYRDRTGASRIVRLLLIPAIYDIVSVRVQTLDDGRLQLIAKQRPMGPGFYQVDGPRPARERIKILDAVETQRFETVFAGADLFALPDKGCVRGLHGFYWVVEARNSTQGYRYRQEHSPETGPEHDLGTVMLELTGWDTEPILRRRPI